MFLTRNPLQLPLVLALFAQHLHLVSKGEGFSLAGWGNLSQTFRVIPTALVDIRSLASLYLHGFVVFEVKVKGEL